MAIVLRIGTVVSTTLLAAGLVLALVAWTNAAYLLSAGLLILMATPIANLLIALMDEIAAREWGFVATGVLVLALLGGSVLIAFS
jgi:uncharacterized membrane protein